MAPFKVFVKRGDYEIKFGIPLSWRSGPVTKILETFMGAYNKKFPDTPINTTDFHLKTEDGMVLASTEVLSTYICHKTHMTVEDGAPPEKTITPAAEKIPASSSEGGGAEAAPAVPTSADMKAKGFLKCKNYGCQKWYDPKENEEGEPQCRHHVSPPIFHDTKKGWTCCPDRLVYDWDNFKLIEGCTVGRHSQVDPKVRFAASPTVQAAEAAEAKAKTQVKSIASYQAANPNAVTGAGGMKKALEKAQQRKVRESDGWYKCRNKGCGQFYDPNNNEEGSCRYHPENPVFHDTIKYYNCCPDKKAYDWDAFTALAGCTVGRHD